MSESPTTKLEAFTNPRILDVYPLLRPASSETYEALSLLMKLAERNYTELTHTKSGS